MSVSITKKAFLSMFFLLPLIAGCSSSQKEGYQLVYSDEFDATSLDESKWEAMLGNGETYGNPGWGNNEEQNYKKENAVVEDGYLKIIAKKEETTINEKEFHVTSARIRSYKKMAVTYGKIEARISLPAIQGTWPAFWMLPEENYNRAGWPVSGEIDIMENRGSSDSTVSGALHYATRNGIHTYESKTKAFSKRNGESVKDFHTYGILWDEESISWYVDDENEPYFTLEARSWHNDKIYEEANAPFDRDFHVLLNMAIGGNFDNGTTVPNDFTQAEMLVDYVRIYQKRG